MPYGESLVEEHNTSNKSPYKFNGKEQDQETGLYYYSARYYEPKIGLFYGVDPLAEKYPHKTPYHYCSSNPVNLVDPDGRYDIFSDQGQFVKSTPKGSAVLVQQGDKTVPISGLDLTNQKNREAVANIMGVYAKELGMSYFTKGGKSVGEDPYGTLGLKVMLMVEVVLLLLQMESLIFLLIRQIILFLTFLMTNIISRILLFMKVIINLVFQIKQWGDL